MQIANVIKKNEKERRRRRRLGLERNDFLNLFLLSFMYYFFYYDSVQKLKSSPNLIRKREKQFFLQ
jgi:hypothetical protein